MSGYDLSDCPDLSSFADLYRPDVAARGPEALRGDLLDVVREAIDLHPRSLQTEIGPSELGHPCNRALAYKFAGVPAVGIQAPKWRATVGTATHDWLSDALHAYNERHGMRWLTDCRVWVGDLYPGRPITGKFDVFDLWTRICGDFKIPGPSGMKRYGQGKPENPQYSIQFDAYGNGAVNAGLQVEHVGSLRLPASGELEDAVWKVVPHNPDRARRALLRAGAIAQMAEALGPRAAAGQPATEHYCGTCEWYRPGSTDLETGCPGAPSFLAAREARSGPPVSLVDLAGPQAVTPATPAVAPAPRRDTATPPAALLALAGTQTPSAPVPGAH